MESRVLPRWRVEGRLSFCEKWRLFEISFHHSIVLDDSHMREYDQRASTVLRQDCYRLHVVVVCSWGVSAFLDVVMALRKIGTYRC